MFKVVSFYFPDIEDILSDVAGAGGKKVVGQQFKLYAGFIKVGKDSV